MASVDWIECLYVLFAIIAVGSWLYRKVKPSFSRPSQLDPQIPASSLLSTPSPSAVWQGTPVWIAGAIGGLAGVVVASFVAAAWISLRPGMPPDMGEVMGYLAGIFICVGGPTISVLAAGISAITHRAVREFQDKDLPLAAHFAIGALLGLVLTVIPASLLLSAL